MQSMLKNVQDDQNRQQKQQDQLWKEYQEWERDANDAEMQIPDNMEADPVVPSAFGKKDQQFVFGPIRAILPTNVCKEWNAVPIRSTCFQFSCQSVATGCCAKDPCSEQRQRRSESDSPTIDIPRF